MEHKFPTRRDASVAAAKHISQSLRRRLATQDTASIVVSGGSSPVDCFAELADTELDWARVNVVLSDERWVAPHHAQSNENLVRSKLLVKKAAEANLISMYQERIGIEDQCRALESSLADVLPFAAVLLGMGTDGHFASLFPDSANLELGLAEHSDRLCIPVQTAASPYPRVSLTLDALTQTDRIVLLMFGDEKLKVYEKANSGSAELPMTHLLRQQTAPVDVYWAP